MMPGEFITLAEESGLIVPLGRWVTREACRQNKEWQDSGLLPITVGVNVSARQFRDGGLISDVREALQETGLGATYLELELTESLLIQNADQAVELMDDFRRLGVKLAIDDFGTGYSSLTALKIFPLTRLKIDRSFISDLDFDESDRCIAKAIISLGTFAWWQKAWRRQSSRRFSPVAAVKLFRGSISGVRWGRASSANCWR